MSDQNKLIISDKLRKQIYRAKLRDQLGDDEYKKQQAQKKREYRAKVKTSKNPATSSTTNSTASCRTSCTCCC